MYSVFFTNQTGVIIVFFHASKQVINNAFGAIGNIAREDKSIWRSNVRKAGYNACQWSLKTGFLVLKHRVAIAGVGVDISISTNIDLARLRPNTFYSMFDQRTVFI